MPKSRGDRPVDMATSCAHNVRHQLMKRVLYGVARGARTTMPVKETSEQASTRRRYLTRPGTKYGQPSLTSSAGKMFANRMTPFGTSGGTRSRAALRMMTL